MDMSSYQFVNTLAQCYEANAQLQGGSAPPPQDYYSMQYPNCYSPATQVIVTTSHLLRAGGNSLCLTAGLRWAVQQHDGRSGSSHWWRRAVPTGLLLHLSLSQQTEVSEGGQVHDDVSPHLALSLPQVTPGLTGRGWQWSRHPGSSHHGQCWLL